MAYEEKFMLDALKEADKAPAEHEVPVGAVVVCEGKIIARAHNRRENKQSATAHAELLAIEKACRKLKSWRLVGCVSTRFTSARQTQRRAAAARFTI